MKILTITEELSEDLELLYPYYRMQEAGFEVELASSKGGVEQKGKHGVPYFTDLSWDDVNSQDYIGLLIPGGWAPDKMRRFDAIKQIVREFAEQKKPIGIICHAGWVPISANILKGRKVTSTPGIMDDMINAGALWVNEPVVVDHNLVSSRWPKDLPVYMKAYIEVVQNYIKSVE